MERDDRDLEKARATGAEREGLSVSENNWFLVKPQPQGQGQSIQCQDGDGTQVKTRDKPFPI